MYRVGESSPAVTAPDPNKGLGIAGVRSVAYGAVAALALTLSIHQGTAVAEETAPIIGNTPAPACADHPSQFTIKAVQKLLVHPPGFTEQDLYNVRVEAANKKIRALDRLPSSTPQEQEVFLDQANAISTSYGLNIKAGEEGTSQQPVSAALSTPVGRQSLEMTLKSVASIPRGILSLANIRNIVMVNNPEFTYTAFVTKNEVPDTNIYLNLAQYADETVVPHEAFHDIDMLQCDPESMDNDPEYQSYNAPELHYTGNDDNTGLGKDLIFNGPVAKQVETYTDKLFDAFHAGKRAAYCKIQAARQAALDKVSIVSEYSLKGVAEDKAELFATIASPRSVAEALDKSMPRVRNKFMLLLARLYERSPKLARQVLVPYALGYSDESLPYNCDAKTHSKPFGPPKHRRS